jgi:uncharacterized protein (TIGR01777 family)
MPKTILMTGATGLIGGYILTALHARGDEVIVLSTHVESAKKKLKNAKRIIKLDDYLSLKDEKIDVIINPAGRNLGEKRWNEEFKKSAYDSRIDTTRKMVELISAMKTKPEVLINSSGTDYYADQDDKILDENSPPGDTFLAKVCIDWEAEAFKAKKNTRVAAMRTGFVMAPGSEAVERLSLPYKFFVGGPIGSGRQYMPWIHIDDVVGIFLHVIDNANVSGPVNVSAPNPETMKEFSKHLGNAMGRPSIFPVPGFMVKIIAGEMAEVILSGRRAIPQKILEAGYKFKFEYALEAWKDIFANSG